MPELIEPLSLWIPRANCTVDSFVADYPHPVLINFTEQTEGPPVIAFKTTGDDQLKKEIKCKQAEKELGVKLSKLTPESQVFYLYCKEQRKDYTIGRAANNDLVILQPQVSKLHAIITCLEDGTRKIKDVSTNGTMVNESTLAGERTLQDKDVIKIAYTTLVYYIPATLHRILGIVG